jgi:hypothetical protein
VINTQNNHRNKSLASLSTHEQSTSKSSPISLSVPILLLPTTNEQNLSKLMPSQHIKTMKVIQSTSSSLSDFIMPTPTSALKNTSKYIFAFSLKISEHKCQLQILLF